MYCAQWYSRVWCEINEGMREIIKRVLWIGTQTRINIDRGVLNEYGGRGVVCLYIYSRTELLFFETKIKLLLRWTESSPWNVISAATQNGSLYSVRLPKIMLVNEVQGIKHGSRGNY